MAWKQSKPIPETQIFAKNFEEFIEQTDKFAASIGLVRLVNTRFGSIHMGAGRDLGKSKLDHGVLHQVTWIYGDPRF